MNPSNAKSSASLDWRAAFRDADQLPQNASLQEKAARGRQFERILTGMLEDSGLRPRLAYRPRGEEVDGSFWMHGRTVLLEAKWTRSQHPASSLYQFRGKVDGKLVGTVGLFVSMAGFSPDAIDALVAGKEVNLILADGADIRAIVEGKWTLSEALDLKLRAAGESGTPFLPLDETLSSSPSALIRHIVIVEGRFDVRVLELLRRQQQVSSPVSIVAAGGPGNMVPLAQALTTEIGGVAKITMVLDEDGLGAAAEQRLREASARAEGDLSLEIIVLRPDLDLALGLVEPDSDWAARRRLRRFNEDQLLAAIQAANVLDRADDPAVAQLLKAIGMLN